MRSTKMMRHSATTTTRRRRRITMSMFFLVLLSQLLVFPNNCVIPTATASSLLGRTKSPRNPSNRVVLAFAVSSRSSSSTSRSSPKQTPNYKRNSLSKKQQQQQPASTTSTSKSQRKRTNNKSPPPSLINPQQQKLSLQTQLDYARNGHTVIRGLLDGRTIQQDIRNALVAHAQQHELAAWQQKVEVVLGESSSTSCQSIAECRRVLDYHFGGHYEVPFLQLFNSWKSLPMVHRLCHALAPTAAQLLHHPTTIRLYQDSLFWKRPGDGPTPWHADARMAPFDTNHMVTFWIPLHDLTNDDDDSALVFCSQSHNDFALPYWHSLPGDDDDDDLDSEWYRLEERYSIIQNDSDANSLNLLVSYLPMNAGDVTAHAGWTLHCADPTTDRERMALAITYVDGSAPVRQEAVQEAQRAMRKSSTNKKGGGGGDTTTTTSRGDGEDAWSYREWLAEVPPRKRNFRHPLVPIVWPPPKKKRNIHGRKKNSSS